MRHANNLALAIGRPTAKCHQDFRSVDRRRGFPAVRADHGSARRQFLSRVQNASNMRPTVAAEATTGRAQVEPAACVDAEVDVLTSRINHNPITINQCVSIQPIPGSGQPSEPSFETTDSARRSPAFRGGTLASVAASFRMGFRILCGTIPVALLLHAWGKFSCICLKWLIFVGETCQAS